MRIFLKTALSVLLAIFLISCSSSPRYAGESKTVDEILAEKNLRVTEEIDQLLNFNIRKWQYVNWENVILEDSPSRIYLVELRSSCRELQSSQSIAFTSFGRQVDKSQKIMVTDGGGHIHHCIIKTLYRLEKIPG